MSGMEITAMVIAALVVAAISLESPHMTPLRGALYGVAAILSLVLLALARTPT